MVGLPKQDPIYGFFKRIACVVGLLVAEYSLLSILFDIYPLLSQPSGLRIFGHLGTLAPLVFIILTSLIIFIVASGTFRQGKEEVFVAITPQSFKSFLLFNVASYMLLVWMTPSIFSSSYWLSLWCICALVVGLSALFAVIPPQVLPLLIRRSGKILLIGCAVGIAAWSAGLWTESLWRPLGVWTFAVVKGLLEIFQGEIIFDAEQYIIGTPQFTVRIAPVCSGYQGVGLMAVFVISYLIWARKSLRFPAALLLLPAAILVVWLSNSIRIAVLIVIGTLGWPDIAFRGFHAKSGWLLFCILALSVVAISRKWQIFQRHSADISTDETWNPAAAYLLPLLAAVGMSMITGLVAVSDVDLLYPLSIIVAGITFWVFRSSISPLEFSNSWFSWTVGIGVGVGWIYLGALFPSGSSNAFPQELAELPAVLLVVWLFFRIAGSCVVVPFIEEIAFRGCLLRLLIDRDFTEVSYRKFTWLSFILSSISFGLLHNRWFAGIIAGILFALVLYHRGKLLDAVFAHALSNTVIAFYVLFFNRWSLWI